MFVASSLEFLLATVVVFGNAQEEMTNNVNGYVKVTVSLNERKKDIWPYKISLPPDLIENPNSGLLDADEKAVQKVRDLAASENTDREKLFRCLEGFDSGSRPAGLGAFATPNEIRRWYSKRRTDEDDELFPKTVLSCAGSSTFAESLGPYLAAAFLKNQEYEGISTDSVWRRGRAVTMVSGRKVGEGEAEAIELAGGGRASEDGADIGVLSDPLPPKAGTDGSALVTVAVDGLSAVVHPKNPVKNISIDQLRWALSDKLGGWKTLNGGRPGDIKVYMGRETAKFLEVGLSLYEEFAEEPRWNETDWEVETRILQDPSGLGILPMSYASRGENKPLPMVGEAGKDGKRSTMLTVLKREYEGKLTRKFYLRLHPESSDMARAFVEFALSEEGQRVVMGAGYAPGVGMNMK